MSMTISTAHHNSEIGPFVHEALLYRDAPTYLNYSLKFIYEGIALEEPVMVAAPPANVRLLQERLGPFAEGVRFHDMTQAGRNPGRIIPWVLSKFMDEHPDHRVRIIGEPIWQGRSGDEYPACVQHEAMINVAFTGRSAIILCPYDVSRLDRQAVQDSYGTHPTMVDGAERTSSGEYDPYGITDAYNVPLSEPPLTASTFRFELTDLTTVRQLAADLGFNAGLPADRVFDLKAAVNELATNSIKHGGGAGTLRTWIEVDRVICEVRDFGQMTNVMLGRLRPPDDRTGGRGLVLVHYLSDLVQRHSSTTGTTTRVHVLR